VIKMVQALRHEQLPPTLHAEEPTPHVDWSAGAVELLNESRPWERGERPRRAGVSSFGISGTNAHLILEEAPQTESQAAELAGPPEPGVLPWLLSAKTETALAAQAQRLHQHLTANPELDTRDVAFTLATARAHLEHRAVLVGEDRHGLLATLDSLAAGEPVEGVARGRARAGKTAFVFPGQGAQWIGMGAELMDSEPVFADAVRACEQSLSAYVDWSLEDVLRGVDGAPSLERVEVVQPALFAMYVSLAALWRSFGVEPDVVIGHSQGEIAAAYVAGGLSLDDAVRIVALRSQAVADLLAGHGGMTSVALAPAAAESMLERWGNRLSLAAVNGPTSVVVTGETDALDELLGVCEEEGIWARTIPVDYPSHSAQVEALRERIEGELADIEPRSGSVPFLSTMSAEVVDTAELGAGYWYRNLRDRVRFYDAVMAAVEDGVGAFIETSPHPGLGVSVTEAVESAGHTDRIAVVGSLRRDDGGRQRMLTALGEAHVAGVTVDWKKLLGQAGARRVDLPTYAFQRERYWLESGGNGGKVSAAGLGAVAHPLLSAMVPLPGDRGVSFPGRVSLTRQPWLGDHAVMGQILFPAAAFAEVVLSAGRAMGCEVLEELTLEAPLVLAEGEEVDIQVVASEDDDGRREVEVYSRALADAGANGDAPEWVRHAAGAVSGGSQPITDAVGRLGESAWPPAGAVELDVDSLYDRLADAGFEYGEAFQGVVAAWRLGEEICCEVAAGELDVTGFAVHPALLDAAFHAELSRHGESEGAGVPLPFALSGLRVHRSGASSLRVRVRSANGGVVNLLAVDEGGQPVLELDSLATREIDADRLRDGTGAGDSLLRSEWVELDLGDRGARDQGYAAVGEVQLGSEAPRYPNLEALTAAGEQDGVAPEVVFASVEELLAGTGSAADGAASTRAGVAGLLPALRTWLASRACADSRLVLVTRGAVDPTHGEGPDPRGAALAGLLRSAQSEHPGRFVLADLGERDDTDAIDWPALLAADEPQLAVRADRVYALRLLPLETAAALSVPQAAAWHLDAPRRGTLEGLALVESPQATAPLGPGEVRIAVRAAGLNFRDVLIALGEYPDDDPVGSEAAGVVFEVGDEVTDLTAGDRVMGLISNSFGPVAVGERRLITRVPGGWSDAEAAAFPIAFLTAYHGLVDLAGLGEGESVLVHAGAGGVGMAAIQIARNLGAEVYATASPAKWDVLRGLGLDDDHIASSRELDFRERFLAATEGQGVDVVLNALAGEFVDASLGLLPRGGRFIEMGKADVRDRAEIGSRYAGVDYRAFDLFRSAGPQRIAEMLGELLELFETGALTHPPIRAWDVRHAAAAFRHLGDGRSVGKLVLVVPRRLDPDGTVLITGGTGDLGARVARHLAGEHGARHLLLTSRRGPEAAGAAELVEQLRGLGAEAVVVACDVSDHAEVSALLGGIDADHALTAVIHTAGVLDDAVIEALTPEQVERVMRPKVDGALLLDELTRDGDLAEFVLFSSQSSTMGAPGQGNYAAANAFLDALAERRRAEGLPAKSLAWGLWSDASGMAGGLDEGDVARIARLGVATMSDELALFDAARESAEAVVIPTRLEMAALRSAARAGILPPLMQELVRGRPRRGRASPRSLERQLAGVPEDERESVVVAFVCEHAATVLGHGSGGSVDPERKFKELGFDSLAAVELRNRLAQSGGLQLSSTLVFDHPSPLAVARYLLSRFDPAPSGDGEANAPADEDEASRKSVDELDVDELVRMARRTK
jgi:polyketide synthase 12